MSYPVTDDDVPGIFMLVCPLEGNLNFSKKGKTAMKIKTNVKAGATNGEVVIGST